MKFQFTTVILVLLASLGSLRAQTYDYGLADVQAARSLYERQLVEIKHDAQAKVDSAYALFQEHLSDAKQKAIKFANTQEAVNINTELTDSPLPPAVYIHMPGTNPPPVGNWRKQSGEHTWHFRADGSCTMTNNRWLNQVVLEGQWLQFGQFVLALLGHDEYALWYFPDPQHGHELSYGGTVGQSVNDLTAVPSKSD